MDKLTEDSLAGAVATLCAVEPRFHAVLSLHGQPSLRVMAQGLEGLLLVVTEQFLSLSAAAAIWQRLAAHIVPLTPETVLACPVEHLLTLGLSRAKARSFHAIATAAQCGDLDFAALESSPDDQARARLMRLHGVGPWTADIYLLAALQRPDVLPAGDLALQLAAQDLFGLEQRPSEKQLRQMGQRFAPWRSVAARLLWSHYRGLKGLKQA